ncbi:hypothetical protein PHLGIDRAFT_272140 [Phlebiopsis gigantea 11061_1 CR5-6]|uniref:Uncharacterized protein n=1 Tax=Phlebiopsis gigantea (strain 11061_1 CR5-6) TaxID=745531 RepID=A0A0C3RRU7_PHLG1|nr:hypothetical protein PHLGIDRAFT_272140 [Phlebiopsis gigantea 11061_1 CR5-6]
MAASTLARHCSTVQRGTPEATMSAAPIPGTLSHEVARLPASTVPTPLCPFDATARRWGFPAFKGVPSVSLRCAGELAYPAAGRGRGGGLDKLVHTWCMTSRRKDLRAECKGFFCWPSCVSTQHQQEHKLHISFVANNSPHTASDSRSCNLPPRPRQRSPCRSSTRRRTRRPRSGTRARRTARCTRTASARMRAGVATAQGTSTNQPAARYTRGSGSAVAGPSQSMYSAHAVGARRSWCRAACRCASDGRARTRARSRTRCAHHPYWGS